VFGSFFFGEAYWAQPPNVHRTVRMLCALILIAPRMITAIMIQPKLDGSVDIDNC